MSLIVHTRRSARGAGVLAALCAVMLVTSCKTLRIDEVQPSSVSSVLPGPAIQDGYCLSRPPYPPLRYNGTADLAMVGFENYYDPGTKPFPCRLYRATVLRGVVQYPLEKYDSVLSAVLLFDTLHSVEGPTPYGMIGQRPGKSFATRIGVAADSSLGLPYFPLIDEVRLGSGSPFVEVDVTGHVARWLSGTRVNAGFLLANDSDPVPDAKPDNNDAQISWYGNFRLRLLYNVPDNPRTPQN